MPSSSPHGHGGAAAHTVVITEQSGLAVHRVEDAQMAAMASGIKPRSVCGAVFTPAALCAPEGVPCPRCAEVLHRSEHEAPRATTRRWFWAVWR